MFKYILLFFINILFNIHLDPFIQTIFTQHILLLLLSRVRISKHLRQWRIQDFIFFWWRGGVEKCFSLGYFL
jgi:hypothetical protein